MDAEARANFLKELLGIYHFGNHYKFASLHSGDWKEKIEASEYLSELTSIVGSAELANDIKKMIEAEDQGDSSIIHSLKEIGINNVRIDRSLARGFDYYVIAKVQVGDVAGVEVIELSNFTEADTINGRLHT